MKKNKKEKDKRKMESKSKKYSELGKIYNIGTGSLILACFRKGNHYLEGWGWGLSETKYI